MSLKDSISVTSGATSITITGGSALVLSNDGRGVNGAQVLLDTSNGNLLTRRKLTTRLIAPKNAPNANSQAKLGRAEAILHTPYVDSNGKQYLQPDSFSITYHPSLTEAERRAKRYNLAILVLDSEMDGLFDKGVNI